MFTQSFAAPADTKHWPDETRSALGLFLITLPPELAEFVEGLIGSGLVPTRYRHSQLYVAFEDMINHLPPNFEPSNLWIDVEEWSGFMPLLPYDFKLRPHPMEAPPVSTGPIDVNEWRYWGYPLDQLPAQYLAMCEDCPIFRIGERRFVIEWPLIADLSREEIDALQTLRVNLRNLHETTPASLAREPQAQRLL